MKFEIRRALRQFLGRKIADHEYTRSPCRGNTEPWWEREMPFLSAMRGFADEHRLTFKAYQYHDVPGVAMRWKGSTTLNEIRVYSRDVEALDVFGHQYPSNPILRFIRDAPTGWDSRKADPSSWAGLRRKLERMKERLDREKLGPGQGTIPNPEAGAR